MGAFQQIWGLYKESGCEVTLHRAIRAQLGSGAASDADAAAVGAFLAELEDYLQDRDLLLLMLSVGLGGLFETQSSFLGLLLREDVLQPRLIDLLLEKLADAAAALETGATAPGATATANATAAATAAALTQLTIDRNVPRLILREIRWIDHVVDPRELVDKLISALPTFPLALQRDVIYILPEIAADEDSHVVIDALLELIRSEADLVVCCIEALGNFNVLTEQSPEVVRCVLQRLDSAPRADLPAIVKYLVQEAPGADVHLIASELRDKVSTALAFADPPTQSTQRPIGNTGNEEALILGSIIQGFYFREDLMKASIVQITKCEGGDPDGGLRLLDVWILVAGHSIPRDRAKLERLFKRQVSLGNISANLLIHSLKRHGNALATYFSSLLHLAGTLISQQANERCRATGSLMYEILFEEFSQCTASGRTQTIFYQGEIVSSLLSFCLLPVKEVADAALKTFVALVGRDVSFRAQLQEHDYVQEPTKRRLRFQLFLPSLKQMLDATEVYNQNQIRTVYDVLFSVGGSEDSELCNILRKQAFHQDIRYRCFGIIGSIARLSAIIRELVERGEDDRLSQHITIQDASTKLHKSVVGLFENSSSHGTCVAFMLEELANWVKAVELNEYSKMLLGDISNFYLEILSQKFMSDFNKTDYHGDKYKKTVMNGTMQSNLMYGLDDEQSPVYLKIVDLALSPSIPDQESLLYLSPLVEVVLECARRKQQVGVINCVLICPVQLIERAVLEDLGGLDDIAQNAVCATLWHAINWMRTILGFFASETDEYYIKMVTERLRNLVDLECMLLDEALPKVSSFVPPNCQVALTPGPRKLADGMKKKVGRPPKRQNLSVDQVAMARQSFSPLKDSVLKIITYPALWLEVQTNSVCAAGGPPCAILIKVLLIGFAEKIERSSEECRTVTGMQKLLSSGCESGGVLQACRKFANHYIELYRGRCENDDEGSDESVDTSFKIFECYLRLGSLLFGRYRDLSRDETILMINWCQDFFLDPEQIVTVTLTSTSEVKNGALESCFQVVESLSVLVQGDISRAGSLIQALIGIVSLSLGYPLYQVLQNADGIELRCDSMESSSSAMSRKINLLALKYLQFDWGNGDRKHSYKAADLDILLKAFLYSGGIVLDNVQTLAIDGFLALMDNNGSSSIVEFPTLSKKTVGIFHKAMFDALVSATSRLDFERVDGNVSLVLTYMMQGVLLFKLLVAITKTFQKSMVIATVLKAGRKFVEAVIKAMPFLQKHFVMHNERILKLISEIQVATRRMQVLCAHGKLVKDAAAAAQVPKVKKLLEKFIYRGEELANAHGILDAFTTGVLKNRRIDGTTISKEELEMQEDSGSETDDDGNQTTEAEDEGSNCDGDDDEVEESEGDSDNERSQHHRKRRK